MENPRSRTTPEYRIQPTLPDDAGYTWIFDSTDPRSWDMIAALGKTAAVPAPKDLRGQARNLRACLGVSCAGQSVTVVFYTLDGAGAWQAYTMPGGAVTLTAGAAPQYIDWSIIASDVLIGVHAAASKPSAIATTLYFVERP